MGSKEKSDSFRVAASVSSGLNATAAGRLVPGNVLVPWLAMTKRLQVSSCRGRCPKKHLRCGTNIANGEAKSMVCGRTRRRRAR